MRSILNGDSITAQYLQQIEEIADVFASVGAPAKDSELISVTLHSLLPEYESFVDSIQFWLGSTTLDELHGLILSKEIQLTNRMKTTSTVPIQAYNSTANIFPTPPSQAFVAQHNPPGRGGDHNFSQGCGGDRGFFNPRNF